MELVWLIPVAGLSAVFYAAWLAWDVLRRDPGTPEMQDVASMIFEGAMAFLRRQYGTIAILAVVTAVVIFFIVGGVSEGVKEIISDKGEVRYGEKVVSRWEEGLLTSIAFIVGAAASALAGYIGMYISVRSNSRTASAAWASPASSSSTASCWAIRTRSPPSSSSALASGPASWRCSRSSAAASTRRLPTSAPTSSARSKRDTGK